MLHWQCKSWGYFRHYSDLFGKSTIHCDNRHHALCSLGWSLMLYNSAQCPLPFLPRLCETANKHRYTTICVDFQFCFLSFIKLLTWELEHLLAFRLCFMAPIFYKTIISFRMNENLKNDYYLLLIHLTQNSL